MTEAELERYRQQLEQLVEERTAALTHTMHEAQKLNEQLQQEIVERKQAEEHLTMSLKEKEILLKEIHHRVKNNLQVISSLLYLQVSRLPTDRARDMFRESQQRIKSMALVHEKLYQSDNITHINFQEYIKTLAAELYASYHSSAYSIQFKFRVETIHFPLNIAIPCGLILNELIANALKYAFPQRSGGITIALHSTEPQGYCLVVSDNGIGLPPSIDIKTCKETLGLQLVKGLVEEQLDGTLELLKGKGTTWRICFQET